MNGLSADLIALLRFLLPGFLAAWVYYGLTPGPKPSQFERVIEALIYTLIVQVATSGGESLLVWLGEFVSLGVWTENSESAISVLVALILGTALAYCTNTDKMHAWCRERGLTKQTSYPSEWFGLFAKTITWVVLHLSDGRRIYGWPREWPTAPKVGHFALEDAEWLAEDADNSRQPLTGVKTILVRAEDVTFVEFMFEVSGNGEEAIESTATDQKSGNNRAGTE
jgi:hypothetical protein